MPCGHVLSRSLHRHSPSTAAQRHNTLQKHFVDLSPSTSHLPAKHSQLNSPFLLRALPIPPLTQPLLENEMKMSVLPSRCPPR